MWPSGTEPLSDHSFSPTPTQLFGMKRSVSQARRINAQATENMVMNKREVNMEGSEWGRQSRCRARPLRRAARSGRSWNATEGVPYRNYRPHKQTRALVSERRTEKHFPQRNLS